MNKLLLLTPLLLAAVAPSHGAVLASERPEASQAPDEETRTVTLDITGMT